MTDNLNNYFSDDEESERLANIALSLLDKSNEENKSVNFYSLVLLVVCIFTTT